MTDEAQSDPLPQPENPITPQNVVSQPEEPALPDASVLLNRIKGVLGEEHPEPPENPQISRLQQQIEALQKMRGFEPPKPQEPKPDQLIKQLQEQQARLQEEQRSWIEEQNRAQATKELSDWVTSQEKHFPLTNAAGFQSVVMMKIENERARTGRVLDPAQATHMVESELSELVKRLAPKLGFVTRDQQTAGREEADIDITTSGLMQDMPADWETMDADEFFQHLKREVERR